MTPTGARDRLAVFAPRWAESPLHAAVGVTIILASAASVVYAALRTSATFARFSEPCAAVLCPVFEQPNERTLAVLHSLGMTASGWAILMVILCWGLLALGVVVAFTLARDVPGRLVSIVTALLALASVVAPFSDERPWLLILINVLLPIFLGLFPTGRWVPRWLRFAWPVAVAVFVLTQVGSPHPLIDVAYLAFLVGVPLYRFWRVSDWTARQQTKWPILGLIVLIVNQVIVFVSDLGGWLAQTQIALVLLDYLGIGLVFAGVLLGLLRYRLYDVHRVIRAASLYAIAILITALVYAVVLSAAGLALSRSSASAVAGIAVAVVALVGGAVALLARRWLRRRLLGVQATPDAATRILAREWAEGDAGMDGVVSTIAHVVSASYVAIRNAEGDLLAEYGEPDRLAYEATVPAPDGATTGTIAVASPGRKRLRRRDRRTVDDLLPMLSLLLKSLTEAEALRAARQEAGTSREEERRRLRSDLHDGVGPLLASQLLALDTLRLDPHGREEQIARIEQTTRAALSEVRRIARDLRPAELDRGGFEAALRSEANRFQSAGMAVELHVDLGGEVLSPATEVALYRITQEALSNASRHGRAPSARIDVATLDGVVVLSVSDTGGGLTAEPPPGTGLESMRRRAQDRGGELELRPRAGGGALVTARMPL